MTEFAYTVVRSARRTISVTVKDDNTVIVKCPYRTSMAKIESFLSTKSGWIERHIQLNRCNAGDLCEILEYRKVLVKGKAVALLKGSKPYFSLQAVCIRNFKDLKRLYAENLAPEFISEFENLSAGTGLKYSGVSFRSYKSRWGCCDRQGKIVFNYKLLMLPEELWKCVMVHELCHTVYMNHSKAFYSLVTSVMPSYKTAAASLKKYSLVCRMY